MKLFLQRENRSGKYSIPNVGMKGCVFVLTINNALFVVLNHNYITKFSSYFFTFFFHQNNCKDQKCVYNTIGHSVTLQKGPCLRSLGIYFEDWIKLPGDIKSNENAEARGKSGVFS